MTDIIEVLKDCDKECEKHGIHFGAFDEAIEIIGQIRQLNKALEGENNWMRGQITDALSILERGTEHERLHTAAILRSALARLDK